MRFSYPIGSGEKYHIRYATSENRVNWKLDLDNAGRRLMLDNGNSYEKMGFGLAVLHGF